MDWNRPEAPALDLNVPSVARMYDYLLGGKDNYVADREACETLLGMVPGIQSAAVQHRRFLERVVRRLVTDFGVRQFIEYGVGLPAPHNNVHEIAQAHAPEASVVYVDNDPVAVIHGHKYLERNEHVAVIRADIRNMDQVLDHPRMNECIDFTQPVAALFVSVLHCIPDRDHPGQLIDTLVDRLPEGSFVAISQLVSHQETSRSKITDYMRECTQGQFGSVRTPGEVTDFFGRLQLMEPGLVEVASWGPDSDLRPPPQAGDVFEFGGVGRLT